VNALAELITRASEAFAERTALVCEDRSLSFAEVEARSNRLACALTRSLGLAKGERVALLLPNSIESILADFALIKAGLVRVPVNARYTAREIEHILRHSEAAAIVTGAHHGAVVGALRGSLPALRHALRVDADACDQGFDRWDDVLAAGKPEPFAVDTRDDDAYMIAYTSGTTGKPKGALTTVRSRWAGLFHTYANELFVTSGDAMLHAASLAHGSGTKVLAFFAKGARNVVMPRFSPADFYRLVEREAVTTTWLVPTMVGMLVDALAEKRSVATLHTIFYAGSPMPAPLLRRALQAFGPIFVQLYGLTEAPQPVLVLDKDEHSRAAQADDSAPVPTGRPAIGVSVKIVDDAGAEVKRGETGEIAVAGKHVLMKYWNDDAATRETLRDGWCLTGDLAFKDERGLYHVVGRKKDMIISGGYNIYPKEVEDVIYKLEGVRHCAIVGEPHPLWGEVVHAFVVVDADTRVTEEAIVEHCRRQLADYKKPRRLSLVRELPLTPNGKPDKNQLRALLAERARDPQRVLS
jgi:acyl-CoA synthetase (AMP-forming)/AMP-acid ligase II